jgi:hypothetical protein
LASSLSFSKICPLRSSFKPTLPIMVVPSFTIRCRHLASMPIQ